MTDSLKATFLTALTDVTLVQKDQLGDIRFNANKWYKYVESVPGGDNVPYTVGRGVTYLGASGHRDSKVVRTTDGSGVQFPAGFNAGGISTGNSDAKTYYGWIQIKGPLTITASKLTAGVADGEYIKFSTVTSDSYVEIAAYTDAPIGRAMDESAGEIYVDCPW